MPDYAKGTTQSNRRLSLSSNAGSVTSEAPRPNGYRAPSGSSYMGASRPGTAQSTRPDTSMSSRGGSIPPIAVKKTRAPAAPRAEAKTSRVRKKSPLNDANAVAGPPMPTEPPSGSSNVVLPTTEIPDSQGSDMDSLTSGMKKVKISLTTKAQREAKQAAKTAPTKPSAAKPKSRVTEKKAAEQPPILPGMKLVPQPEPAPSASNNGPSPNLQTEEPLPRIPSTPQHPLPPSIPALQQASQVPLPASSPAAPQLSPLTPATEQAATQPASTPDNFIPYQPEGPTPNPVIQQQHLHWLPPNTNTPSPMKRGDLPVFTSTGAIPFGVNPRTNGETTEIKDNGESDSKEKAKEEEKEVDIWAVPETPEAKRPLGHY